MPETTVEYSIKAGDIDSYGHLDNKRYFDYLEDARHEWQDRLGISDERLVARRIGLFVAKREIEYKKPIKEVVKIVTIINEFRGPILKIWQEMYDVEGELCATCLTRQGFVDLKTERPLRKILEDITEKIREYCVI